MMEERENYSSLQEFTEQPTPEGNRLILQNRNGSQGLRRGVECLRSLAGLLMLIGFLASICANIALTVLLVGRPVPAAEPLDSTPLGLKLTSLRRRCVQLCEDYTAQGQSCSKPGGSGKRSQENRWI